MDAHVLATFTFGQPQPVDDAGAWTARLVEWDPYRHMCLVVEVTLQPAHGDCEVFEKGMVIPPGVSAADREEVWRAVDFEVRYRLGLFRRPTSSLPPDA
jgi:hypothetical protein